MPSRFRRRLAIHFSAIYVILWLAALVLGVRFATHQVLRRFETDLRESIVILVSVVDTETRVIPPSAARMRDLLKEAVAGTTWRGSWFSPEGKLLADSHHDSAEVVRVEYPQTRAEVDEAIRLGVGQIRRRSTSMAGDFLYTAARVGPAEAPRAVLRLGVPGPEVDRAIAAVTGPVYAASVVLLLLGVGAILWTAYRLARPVRRLWRGTRAVSSGDYERAIPVFSGDELEEIAAGVTGLGAALRSREAREKLASEELRQVLESVNEGVLMVGPDGRVLMENAALRGLLPGAGPLVGRLPVEAVRSPEFEAALGRVLRGGGRETLEVRPASPVAALRTEARPDEPDGVRVLHVTVTPFDAGTGRGAVAILTDLSRLRQLEGIRSDFVANVSHELRTPLTAIRGFIETLADPDIPPADRERFLARAAHHTERLSALIEDLLELSRLEAPGPRLDFGPVALIEVVDRALAAVEPLALRKGVARIRRLPPDLPPVVADHRALEHVLVNLLDNAIKWTATGGTVTVGAERMGERIKVLVSDTGAGIPPADLPRIFERFYRVDRSRTRDSAGGADAGGTGLGLAIVKHLVRLHGGEVGVESLVGKGSSFWITLRPAGRDAG